MFFNRSSIVGSITHTKRFMISPDHGYRVSKAALNCLTSIFAYELEDEGFTFVAVSPGVRVQANFYAGAFRHVY
jgi:NAD(P)-dependent dehydrogenase (short-subunit alcohol dehydrogenase family)